MERDNSSMIMWLVSGAVLGAAVALLLAPESGEGHGANSRRRRTRPQDTPRIRARNLFERGRELYERGREIAEDAAQMFERGRGIAEKTVDERI